ncbi:MAG: trypsin-like peptidase domain-containing protein [Planctomycetota bacterium]
MRRRGVRACGWILVALLAPRGAATQDQPDAARQRRRTPIVAVFEGCRDAVVNISTTRIIRMRSLGGSPFEEFFNFAPLLRDRTVQSVGSGVIVHEAGYIVTNAHVVAQATDVHVTFADGTKLPAERIAMDTANDLAVLRANAARPLSPIRLGRSHDLMVGETVIAIGNPLGLDHTVTTGIISAVGRDVQFSQEVTYKGLIQTDAPINPGNSGGPLLNINGELIGVNTAIRGDAQNIGFAIAVDRLWELLPSLLDLERRTRVRFGLHVGGADAKVVEVRAQSPADAAGLKPGDRIVRFNGHALRNGIDYYVQLLGQQAGNKIKLAVQRGGKTFEVAVPLQEAPIPDGRILARNLFGMELEELSDELRRSYGLPEHVGLVVRTIDRSSSADRARMKPADLILGLNGARVTTLKDVGLALEQAKPGELIDVEGVRIDADPPFAWTVKLPARGGRPSGGA